MIRLVNDGRPDDTGLIAVSDTTPFAMKVTEDKKYSIFNRDTGVDELTARAFIVNMLAMLEGYESTYKDYLEAGSVEKMSVKVETEAKADAVPEATLKH